MNQPSLPEQLRHLVANGTLDAPVGPGAMRRRLRLLAGIAHGDLALARLAEAHLDAVTILREAGHTAPSGTLYGVWASEAPGQMLELVDGPPPTVSGGKGFCGGATIVDRALVTVHHGGDVVLIDIDARHRTLRFDQHTWHTEAFIATNTWTAHITRMPIGDDDIVAPETWYLDRVGFWHGALAPAACWAGGAIGLIEHCLRTATGKQLSAHQRAALGRLDIIRWQLDTQLDHAAEDVAANAADRTVAITTAHRFRGSVAMCVDDAIALAVSCFGPRLLAHDRWAARRIAELQLSVLQHHGDHDHEQLGLAVIDQLTPAASSA